MCDIFSLLIDIDALAVEAAISCCGMIVATFRRCDNRLLLQLRNESLVELRLFGDEIVNEKILEDSISSVPYFIVGALLMVVFVFVTVLRYNQVRCDQCFELFLVSHFRNVDRS